MKRFHNLFICPRTNLSPFLLNSKFMIHQKAIDNLIAQTNYLSSMFQAYYDVLLKQSHAANEDKSIESQMESIFESEESKNSIQAQNFLSNEGDFNLPLPYLSPSSYYDDLLDHEIHDRPTGYMRNQDKKELNGKILAVEKSIELCFKAIQSQLQIRTKLKEKEMLTSSVQVKSKNIPLKSSIKSKKQSVKSKAK